MLVLSEIPFIFTENDKSAFVQACGRHFDDAHVGARVFYKLCHVSYFLSRVFCCLCLCFCISPHIHCLVTFFLCSTEKTGINLVSANVDNK